MRDFIYLLAGAGVWIAICYGLFAFCIIAFLLWFGHYLLIDHWKQQREQRERAARRAKYAAEQAAQYTYEPVDSYSFEVDFGDE